MLCFSLRIWLINSLGLDLVLFAMYISRSFLLRLSSPLFLVTVFRILFDHFRFVIIIVYCVRISYVIILPQLGSSTTWVYSFNVNVFYKLDCII